MNLFGVTTDKIEDFRSKELHEDISIVINRNPVKFVFCERPQDLQLLYRTCDMEQNCDLRGCFLNFTMNNDILKDILEVDMGSLYSIKIFNNRMYISFKNMIFYEGIDLTLAGIEGTLEAESIQVSFNNCIFMKEINLNFINEIFTSLKFERCALLVDAFKNDGFNEIIIMGCNVTGAVQLNYPANIFSECILDKVVLFDSRFEHDIDFTEKNLTKLEIKKMLIKSCIFKECLNLNHIVFKEEFLIEKTRFSKDLKITFCKFSQEMAVLQCFFVGDNIFNITNCKFSSNAEIKLNRVPQKLYIYDTLIAGRFVIHVKVLRKILHKIGIVDRDESEGEDILSIEKTVENYFKLYQIFVSNGEIECAHKCYYMYKRFSRHLIGKRIRKTIRDKRLNFTKLLSAVRMIFIWNLMLILEKSTKYFTSVVSSVLTLVITFLAFTSCYFIFPSYIIVNNVPLSRSGELGAELISNVVSFSLITLGTTGYGNIYPTGWMAIVAALESLFGVVMFAVLVTIIARKFMG